MEEYDLSLEGVQIDYEKVKLDEWSLYFTGGYYLQNNQLRAVSPGVIHLPDYDFLELEVYDVYYNPRKNQYNVLLRDTENAPDNFCSYNGIHLGSFTIQGCTIKWQYPEAGCVHYTRAFQDGFDDGYDEHVTLEECGLGCKSYSIEFSTEFNTELGDCEPNDCRNSIGAQDGTQYILGNFLLPDCVIARIDCGTSVGGADGTEFNTDNNLYRDCTIAVQP